MIDLKQELQSYSPIKLNILDENEANVSEDVRTSIDLYNKALGSLNAYNEDIAIIELKRAIVLVPDFYEAMNLLGVCYSWANNDEKAIEMFQKVADEEKNGVKAMRYISYLQSGSTSEKANMSSNGEYKKTGESNSTYRAKNMKKNRNWKRNLIKNAFFMVIGALIMLLIVSIK